MLAAFYRGRCKAQRKNAGRMDGFYENGTPGEEWKPYTEEKPYVQVFDV